MFDSLTDRITGIFDNVRGRGKLSDDDVDAVLREVRLALLEADVAGLIQGIALRAGRQAGGAPPGASILRRAASGAG